jgi:predicted acyltransferase
VYHGVRELRRRRVLVPGPLSVRRCLRSDDSNPCQPAHRQRSTGLSAVSWSSLSSPLLHYLCSLACVGRWNGLTIADLVFPWYALAMAHLRVDDTLVLSFSSPMTVISACDCKLYCFVRSQIVYLLLVSFLLACLLVVAPRRFMWMMGVSMALSLSQQERLGASKKDMSVKIIVRSIKLFCIGLFLNNGMDTGNWRVPGVLQVCAGCRVLTSVSCGRVS